MTPSLAIVIPTRNRTELARNAIRSLRDQDCPLEIWVSDNSSVPDAELRAFCDAHGVSCIRPPREMSTPAHWDWAIREVMARSSTATHFGVHYDRKWSRRGEYTPLRDVVTRWPDQVVTFGGDAVADDPLRLWRTPWTGKLFAIDTAAVTRLTAQGRINEIAWMLPLLSNCIVPRAILNGVIARFGDLCDSTSPDSAFALRFYALYDRYLYLDRSVGVLYSPHRSTGAGYLRDRGGDWADYEKLYGRGEPVDRSRWLHAAPIPGVNLGQNALFHEYELVRRETGDRLPPIDRDGYLEHLADGLSWKRGSIRKELRQLLRDHGWKGMAPAYRRQRLRSIFREKVLRFFARTSGGIPNARGVVFRDDRHALQYALEHPRRPSRRARHLAVVKPVEMTFP
jgi:glycosyltransferase involved in cell wall biosynthesis